MDNQHTIEDSLLIAYLKGEADQSQIEQVELWLSCSEQNQKDFEKLKSAWFHSDAVADFEAIDVEANWQQLKQKLQLDAPKAKQHFWRPAIWRYAAAVILISAVGYLALQFLAQPEMIEVTALAEELKVDLPDGSQVWLNKGATLSYPETFVGGGRNVSLKGEAFFEVAHDPSKPFKVEADGTFTEVLGTSFNLSEMEASALELVLVTGKVSFSAGEQKVIMLPGETVKLDGSGNLTKQPNENRNFLSWKTGKLEFRNTPMTQAIQDVESLYGVKIEIKNAEFATCPITTTFENENLDDVLKAFKTLFNATIEKVNDTYIIDAQGC